MTQAKLTFGSESFLSLILLGSGLVVFLTSNELTELLTPSGVIVGFPLRAFSLTIVEPFGLVKVSDPCDEVISRAAAGRALF